MAVQVLPIKGEEGILYIHDGTIYRPVACLTSNSLSTTVSIIESVTKCYPGETIKQAGAMSYTIDAEGEYIDTTSVGGDVTKASHDFLLEQQMLREMITWKLDTGAPEAIYYGTGIITDLSLDQGAGDEISTFSVTIEGSGAITTVDPIVPPPFTTFTEGQTNGSYLPGAPRSNETGLALIDNEDE